MKTGISSFIHRVRSALRGINSNNAYLMQDVLRQLAHLEILVRLTEERSRTLESQLDTTLVLVRTTEERSQTLENLVRASDERSRTLESQLNTALTLVGTTEERTQALESLVRTVDERSRTLESQLDTALTLVRTTEERTQALESLVRTVDERSRTLESQLDTALTLVRTTEERSRVLESQLDSALKLVRTVDDRSRTIEAQLDSVRILVCTFEERTQTLEYLARQSLYATNYQVDQLQKFYVESMRAMLDSSQLATFNASRILELETNFPIAVDSNDHINPDSTTEGLARPTFFVQDCISVLGKDIKCLDLGTGAAGLVFEFAMSGVLAIGVDGSDFCRVNRIGYWPLLPYNLFNCDITKPFRFSLRDTQAQNSFDIITMWEVLEHIAEYDLPGLFRNIAAHLAKHGYFIGSVSLVEYLDGAGNPYHVTLKPRDWWKAKFKENGLLMVDTHPFNEKFFCRGNGPRFQDIHNYANKPNEGFWFVAQRTFDNEQVAD